MIRKEPADIVFYNVSLSDSPAEAVAIYEGVIVGIGSIPFVFSNFRGFIDYNAQANHMLNNLHHIEVGQRAHGLQVCSNESKEIIWEINNGQCMEKGIHLLDPDWDNH